MIKKLSIIRNIKIVKYAAVFISLILLASFHFPEKKRHPSGNINPKILFEHNSFKDFSKGTLSDCGANLYVSKKGNIQFINLFDLNADGYPEVVINNDHNSYETPDALVYYNRGSQGFHSLFNPTARDAPAYQNLKWTLESLSSITRLPTEGGGKSVLTDVNMDGYKDLVFVNFIHGSTLVEIPAYIYWGGADGLNPSRRSVLPADRGTAVAVDDVTGDGLPDIVISNSGREHLALETPDFSSDALAKLGGTREKSSYLYTQTESGFSLGAREVIATNFAVDVKIADLNNDGKKELVFLELGEPGAIRIVEHKQGKWITSQLISAIAPKPLAAGKRIYQELLIKDLNGDGYPDIFAPSAGLQSEIFWNNKGQFSLKNRTIIETENAMSADADDLNKDGITDLVIANFFSKDKDGKPVFETNSYVWWGSKQGFSKDNRTALPTMGAVSVRLADLNNTGSKDILFAQHRNRETNDVPSYIYMHSPKGFFAENRIDLQGFGAVNILADDLDGDGKKEVILINSLSGKARQSGIEDAPGNEAVSPDGLPMYIYRGNPNKIYGVANLIRVPESSAETNIAFADIEDNEKTALVHLRGGGFRLVIRYDVYNYPNSKELTEIAIPFRANSVNVADYDKDGILDILVTPIAGPQAILFFGLGNRQYRSEIFDFPHLAYTSAIGDVNNDGLLDAVTASHKEICILFGNKEGGKFHFNKPQIVSTNVLTTRVSLADFNKDGWLDILSENSQNDESKSYDIESWVLINNKGSFSFDNKRSFHTFGANGGTVAQLNGDGKLDVVISNYHADISRRTGAFILQPDKEGFPSDEGRVSLPAFSAGANLVLDYNGDGYQDIIVYNHSGADVYNGNLTPTGGIHGVGSIIYWGDKNGYSLTNSTHMPSFGPHSRISADPGSLANRNSYETYTSEKITNTTGSEYFNLTIFGGFNKKQFVSVGIMMMNETGMETSIIPTQIHAAADTVIYSVKIPKDQAFRYKLFLNSSNSGNGPIISGVRMVVVADPLKNVLIVEEKMPSPVGPLVFSEGIPVYTSTSVNYKRNNKTLLNIQFEDPVTVSVASKPEKWGFFQFPNIGHRLDGSLQVRWSMTKDAIESYGTSNAGYAVSADIGKTWKIEERSETVGGISLPNGDRLQISTPKPIKVEDLILPKSIGTGTENYSRSRYTFYKLNDMPESRQGVFFKRLKKGETEWKEEQASLYDPNAARYSLSGLVPVVWWGDMQVAADGSLYAGVYPGFLIGENGLTDPKSGTFFYKSTDGGHSWRIQGRIPYHGDLVADSKANERMGFTEPAFEILKDGTFLCIMRTSDGAGYGPMYACYSKDMGKTWTQPEAITPTGVLPQLLKLNNGIIVISSGRPGVQLRFSINGDGKQWTEPFEMLPYLEGHSLSDLSCGYTGLLAIGPDRFWLVFSDFKYKIEDGSLRKAIKVREVIVKPN